MRDTPANSKTKSILKKKKKKVIEREGNEKREQGGMGERDKIIEIIDSVRFPFEMETDST